MSPTPMYHRKRRWVSSLIWIKIEAKALLCFKNERLAQRNGWSMRITSRNQAIKQHQAILTWEKRCNEIEDDKYTSLLQPTTKPWGRHAPASWSGDESPYSGPSYSPVKPKFNPPPPSTVPEPVFSPAPTQNVTKYGDFNAKPKGFGSWNAESKWSVFDQRRSLHVCRLNVASKSPRTSVDLRKPLNLQMGPGIRQGQRFSLWIDQDVLSSRSVGMAESYGKPASQPWSPSSNNQAMFSPTQPPTNDYFNYPSDNILSKWKNQDYTPWNQQTNQEQHQTQIPMTREGVDTLRQRLTQQNPSQLDQQYKQYATAYNQRPGNNMYSPSQGPSASTQKHFTDLWIFLWCPQTSTSLLPMHENLGERNQLLTRSISRSSRSALLKFSFQPLEQLFCSLDWESLSKNKNSYLSLSLWLDVFSLASSAFSSLSLFLANIQFAPFFLYILQIIRSQCLILVDFYLYEWGCTCIITFVCQGVFASYTYHSYATYDQQVLKIKHWL